MYTRRLTLALWLALIAGALNACDGMGYTPPIKVDLDLDDDGSPDDEDCAPDNPAIYPYASEICDGLDNDCDTLTDDADPELSLIGAMSGYPDRDGDTYGSDVDAWVVTCQTELPLVDRAGDCLDGDPAVSPDALEVCDGVDNDCDGLTDDADPSVADAEPVEGEEPEEGLQSAWPDTDGDGYGDVDAAFIVVCLRPEGYALNNQDCDDDDAEINPIATEVCNQGTDDDCDGEVDDLDPSLDESTGEIRYQDADGDEYGDPDTSGLYCSVPTGWTDDDTDCDDTDGDVHPGAHETRGDGVDSDCDGSEAR